MEMWLSVFRDGSKTLCRVCLATDVRMHCIKNTQLLKIYEKLSSTQINTEDDMSKTVCYICFSQLERCRRFFDLSHKSEKMLTDQLQHDIQIERVLNETTLHATYNLAVSPIHSISVESSSDKSTQTSEADDESSVKREELMRDVGVDVKAEALAVAMSIKKETSDDEDHFSKLEENPRNIQHPVKNPKRSKSKKATEEYQHKCGLCKKTFATKYQVVNHMKTHTEGKPSYYTCTTCNKTFSFKKSWQQHLRIHTDNKFLCNICSKIFNAKANLIRHNALVHKVLIQYPCKKCTKNYTDRNEWQQHMRMHAETNQFVCQYCSKSFERKKNLNEHIKNIHSGEKRYSCEVCSELVDGRLGLIAHMKIHTGDKPNSCDICGQVCATKSHLNRHIKIHTGEKPYGCNLCDKRFIIKSHLVGHMRSHTGEKPYSCDRCGKTYTQKHHLSNHIMNIHTGERRHACDLCGKKFVEKSNLIKHRRSHTGEKPFICEICSKAYSEKFQLKIHMKNHTGDMPYKCDQCTKSFPMKCYLIRHVKWTHDGVKPFSCDVCGKTFTHSGGLNSHMRTHTGEKPYSCVRCSKTFSAKSSLKLHMKTHAGE